MAEFMSKQNRGMAEELRLSKAKLAESEESVKVVQASHFKEIEQIKLDHQ